MMMVMMTIVTMVVAPVPALAICLIGLVWGGRLVGRAGKLPKFKFPTTDGQKVEQLPPPAKFKNQICVSFWKMSEIWTLWTSFRVVIIYFQEDLFKWYFLEQAPSPIMVIMHIHEMPRDTWQLSSLSRRRHRNYILAQAPHGKIIKSMKIVFQTISIGCLIHRQSFIGYDGKYAKLAEFQN